MQSSSPSGKLLLQVKRAVRSRFPAAVAAYHSFRQTRRSYGHSQWSTALGFQFAGHAQMQIGTFEAEEVAVLRKSFADTDVFVDIGANIGYYTCLARQAGNHVVAVEPVPQNLEFLYANLRANRWLDIEVFPVALSEQSGIGLMFGGGTGASLIAGWAGASEVWQTPVPLTTLDVLLGDRFKDQRLLIKMDVEGAELGVLRGAEMTLTRKLSPIWFIEVCLTENQPTGVNSSFAAVFELFWKFGYTARTGDRDARLVTPENVKQWVNEKRREFGSANYLFSRA